MRAHVGNCEFKFTIVYTNKTKSESLNFKMGEFAYCPLPADIKGILTYVLCILLSIPFILLKSGIFSNMGGKGKKETAMFSPRTKQFERLFSINMC